MPRQHPSSPLPAWELALAQLRTLAPADLDRHIDKWLRSHQLSAIRLIERNARASTYAATFGQAPFDLPVACRVYQRRNRLQAYDVESFRGTLLRQGIVAGVLITSGDFSRQAYRAAAEGTLPTIRLIAGPEWLADLAKRRVSVRRRTLTHWLIEQHFDRVALSWLPQEEGR